MDINKANRATLKAYFKKNSIPTESNFADLIDATLNQKDDGIVKKSGEPLSIIAEGGANSQQKAINFYGDSAEQNPAWTLQLNPYSDPNTAATAKAGFSISDGQGSSRLFIDKSTGAIAIGTINPSVNSRLNIVGGALAVNLSPQKADASIHVTTSFGGFDRLLQMSPSEASKPGLNLVASRTAGGQEQWWSWGVDTGNNWRIQAGTNFDSQHGLTITAAGNIGMGALPDRKLTLANTTGANYMNIKDGTREMLMGVDSAGGIVSVMSNHDLIFRTGSNSEKMRITANGLVGIGKNNPAATLDILASTATWNGWYEAIRFSQAAHSAITHPQGGLLFGMHSDRTFYFADTVKGQYMMMINANPVNIYAPVVDIVGRMRVRQTTNQAATAGIWFSGYYNTQETDAAFAGMKSLTEVGFWGNTGASPNWRFWVNTDTGALTISGAYAYKPGGGTWTSSSDERLKQNIRPLEKALDKLLRLHGKQYEWKEPEKQGNLTGPQIGLIAQEVEAVFPEWIGVDAQGFKTLTIRGFEALAIEALKELKAENESLKKRCERLEASLKDWKESRVGQ